MIKYTCLITALLITHTAFAAGTIPYDCDDLDYTVKMENNPYKWENPNVACEIDLSLSGLPTRGGGGYLTGGFNACKVLKGAVDDALGLVNSRLQEKMQQISQRALEANPEIAGAIGDEIGFDFGAAADGQFGKNISLGKVGVKQEGLHEAGKIYNKDYSTFEDAAKKPVIEELERIQAEQIEQMRIERLERDRLAREAAELEAAEGGGPDIKETPIDPFNASKPRTAAQNKKTIFD